MNYVDNTPPLATIRTDHYRYTQHTQLGPLHEPSILLEDYFYLRKGLARHTKYVRKTL
jgi:hypothetical protein